MIHIEGREMRLVRCPTLGVRHRYPTRWRLARHTSQGDAPRVAKMSRKHQGLVACKRTKVSKRCFYLPPEIMFKILLLIPAKFLHEVVRTVCKQWYDIVTDPLFVTAHHQSSSPAAGLLVQMPRLSRFYDSFLIQGDDTKLNLTDIPIPFPSIILNSYHGLLLLADTTNRKLIYVVNPATNLKISLPPMRVRRDFYQAACIGIDSSGHYKVVHAFGSTLPHPHRAQMTIFTIGVDKAWRFIDLQGIRGRLGALLALPLFIAGYIYWNNPSRICYAMDLDTETIYEFDYPKGLRNPCVHDDVDMGTALGVMEAARDVWKMWKLTDVKSGEWIMVGKIDMEPVLSRLYAIILPSVQPVLRPVAFIDGEFWFFFRVVDEVYFMVSFNLINKNLRFVRMEKFSPGAHLIPHVDTLISPISC